MSAWMVSKNHLDVMVTAAISLGLADKSSANEIGEMLQQENCSSLMARYGDRYEMHDGTLPNPGEYLRAGFIARPDENLAHVAKQVHCYQYQACEHEGWNASEARALTDQMLVAIAAKLNTSDLRSLPLYIAAPWGD